MNVGAFLMISAVVLHFKVPVETNIDFQVLKAFIGLGFVGNSFFFITIVK